MKTLLNYAVQAAFKDKHESEVAVVRATARLARIADALRAENPALFAAYQAAERAVEEAAQEARNAGARAEEFRQMGFRA